MKRTILTGAFLWVLTSTAGALTNEQANNLKYHVLHDQLPVLTVACGIVDDGGRRYQRLSVYGKLSCALAMRIIVDDFVERGYMGHSICPPAGTEYGSFFDTITNHIVLQNPVWTERAVDVAMFALMRAYPCKR
jgi:hypothetical protein